MPDKFGFNHLPDSGQFTHRCIECGWPEESRWVNDKEREKHHTQHQRLLTRALEKTRRDNLAKAQQAQRELTREATVINERFGAPGSKEVGNMAEEATQSDNGQLASELEAAVIALPAKLVEKKAYHRVDQDGLTLGYLYLGVRKPSVEIPTGHGSYERVSLTTAADIPVVISKLTAVAERAAAKQAAKDQPAEAAAPAAAAEQVEVEPDPKTGPKRRKTRTKTAA